MFQIQSVLASRPHGPSPPAVPCPGTPSGSGPGAEAVPCDRPQAGGAPCPGRRPGSRPHPGPQAVSCPCPGERRSRNHWAGSFQWPRGLRRVGFWSATGRLHWAIFTFLSGSGPRICWKVWIRLGNLWEPWDIISPHGAPWTGRRVGVSGILPAGSPWALRIPPGPPESPRFQVLTSTSSHSH